jgi:hypothetical protein
MVTQRPFEELNLWQRIFADHWEGFAAGYEKSHGEAVPENWQENVEKMLSCGDIREGYYEYFCVDCGHESGQRVQRDTRGADVGIPEHHGPGSGSVVELQERTARSQTGGEMMPFPFRVVRGKKV